MVFAGTVLALPGCVSPPAPVPASARASAAPLSGDASIRARAGGSEIVITTTSRVAGAIHSLTWGGKEFIDSVDHGRQLQSASNFDAGQSPIRAETYNPTEAGSRLDHVGPLSTTRLLEFEARGNFLRTKSQMAFWLAPGEKSGEHPARNSTRLSNHLLAKRVTIGWRGHEHVIAYDVVFTVPAGEPHQQAVFESLTGYMPADFEKFWAYDARAARFEPLTDGPGEQLRPVVLATVDGKFAMGIFSPDAGARYGRFRFAREQVVKWNCVFRPPAVKTGFPPGDYAYRHFVVVGDLATVVAELKGLVAEFAAAK